MSDAPKPVLAAHAPVAEYESLFVGHIADHLERAPKPLTALDFSCGRGVATRGVHGHLPPGSRVVAIGDDRPDLNIFHQEMTPAQRNAIFLRKESATRLPFAEGAFDLAWASLATHRLEGERKHVLRQVIRALRPPGQLLIATPLRETVVELRSAITSILQSEGESSVRALLEEDTSLTSADEWQEACKKAGAVEVGVT
ncbi:MAG: methyltransferase domain-containing protein, partial [Myxococcota bacterium]